MALFGWSRRSERQDALENVIGPTTSLRGHIKSDGGARIDGRFEGRIEVAGNVIVTERGCVIGDIFARDVTIGGTVEGNIEGAGRLEILSTGKLFGDVTAAAILIDDGGVFEGISRMHGAARPALPPPTDVLPALEDVVIDLERRPEARAKSKPAPSEAHPPATVVEEMPTTAVDATARVAQDPDPQRGPAAVAQAAAAAAAAAAALGGGSAESDAKPREEKEEEPVAPVAPPAPPVAAKQKTTATRAGNKAAATMHATPAISKVASRLIAENKLDVTAIRGTGHRGMITKADVRRVMAEQQRAGAAERTASTPSDTKAHPSTDSSSHPVTVDQGQREDPASARETTTEPKVDPGAPKTAAPAEGAKRSGPQSAIVDLSDLNIEPVIPEGTPRTTAEAATTAPTSSAPATSKRAGTRRSSRGRKRGR
jgi:cytoskeletal protein CcmA (bactofilin family)